MISYLSDFIYISSYEKVVQVSLFWWLYNILLCWHHLLTYRELLVLLLPLALFKSRVLGLASIQWLLHLLFKNTWEGYTSRNVTYSHGSFCLSFLFGLFPWWTELDHLRPLNQVAFHLFHLLDHTVDLYILTSWERQEWATERKRDLTTSQEVFSLSHGRMWCHRGVLSLWNKDNIHLRLGVWYRVWSDIFPIIVLSWEIE